MRLPPKRDASANSQRTSSDSNIMAIPVTTELASCVDGGITAGESMPAPMLIIVTGIIAVSYTHLTLPTKRIV